MLYEWVGGWVGGWEGGMVSLFFLLEGGWVGGWVGEDGRTASYCLYRCVVSASHM